MSRISTIFLAVALIIFIFILGAGAGVVFQTQKDAPKFLNADKNTEIARALSSKTVPSIVAYGQVSTIDVASRNITLSYMNDSITVRIAETAQIFSFAKTGTTGTSTQQPSNFADIKKGDTVSVNLKLLPDGTLVGSMVNILIPFGSANNAAK